MMPNKFFPIPDGLCNGVQVEPVDLTINKRSSPSSTGSSPSPLKYQPVHRRASPGLNLPSPSPPMKKLTPPGIQPFSLPISIPPVMAALSRHGLQRSGILPVIQPVVVQPVLQPFMYPSQLQQSIMVSTVFSDELENPSSVPGKYVFFWIFPFLNDLQLWTNLCGLKYFFRSGRLISNAVVFKFKL